MKQFIVSSRCMILALLLITCNYAFASIENHDFSPNSKSTGMPSYPASAAPVIKKLPLLKRLVQVPKYKIKKAGEGSMALVVIVAVLLALLLSFGIYIFAFGGASTTLLTLIGLVGLALIIFGVARIIRAIKRKRERLVFNQIQSGVLR